MAIIYHEDLIQGSDAWLAARCGLMTASEMKHILTPTLKIADNDKTRSHLWELLAQRVTRYVEPSYIGDDMLRGMTDEIEARRLYHIGTAKVHNAGFVTNDEWGFTIGYSPDGLVGDEGLIEAKSRRQKFQVQTFAEGIVPPKFMLQLQTGLLVTRRKWIDFISYSGGLPMFVHRVEPDSVMQEAIILAATVFEARLAEKLEIYRTVTADLPLTERIIEREMI
jgi:YqaJ-like viral recombinase domain